MKGRVYKECLKFICHYKFPMKFYYIVTKPTNFKTFSRLKRFATPRPPLPSKYKDV